MNTPCAIAVIKPGFHTTIQDIGRSGLQEYGMPVGGAMDQISFQRANYLVSNPNNSAALEVTFTGPTLLFHKRIVFAICGAHMKPSLNNKPISNNKTIVAQPGDVLSFGTSEVGSRCYIAFSGGIDVSVILGSRSTCLVAGIGGLKGSVLIPGDALFINENKNTNTFSHIEDIQYPNRDTIHIIPGPEAYRLTKRAVIDLLKAPFVLHSNSNRMAIKLSGPRLSCKDDNYDIISAGTTMGLIQLPGDGYPLILMADRPTMGGYPRIGYVAGFDLPKLSQYLPGKAFYFKEISHRNSQKKYKEWLMQQKPSDF